MNKSSEISIHDNFLLGYEVNATERKIVLRTEFRDAGGSKKIDVIFSDVIAYNFINDSFGTLLYAIAETDSNQLVIENWKLFEDGWKAFGWPGDWVASPEKASAYLSQNSIRGFNIESSIGMSGWVLAKSMMKKFIK